MHEKANSNLYSEKWQWAGEDGLYFEILRSIGGAPQESGILVPAHGESEESDVKKMIARVKIIGELKRWA